MDDSTSLWIVTNYGYGFLVANEVVDDLKGNDTDSILCKLDMKKAYDHVSWDFVDYMLGRLSSDDKWRRWIRVCITSTSFAVLIIVDTWVIQHYCLQYLRTKNINILIDYIPNHPAMLLRQS